MTTRRIKFQLLIAFLSGSTLLGHAGQASLDQSAPSSRQFTPGAVWRDIAGQPINAHSGGILFHQGVYYWYGEFKAGRTYLPKVNKSWGGTRVLAGGVSCYSSTNLYDWIDRGLALPSVAEDPDHDLACENVIERPKVIYNARTGKFVMWLHQDSPDYAAARSGVAVSDSPAGPFKYLGSFRPNAGVWPLNVTDADQQPCPTNFLARDFKGGQMARDTTLFVDDDGKAYQFYASEGNETMHVSELTDDYLKPSGKYARILPGRSMEAPAVFKRNGKYYLIASGCTAWDPNAARSAVADNIFGPWTELGNPCRGPDADKTFFCQSTFALPVAGQPGLFIAMFDRWNKWNLQDSRYVWLPLKFDPEAKPTLRWQDRWSLSPPPVTVVSYYFGNYHPGDPRNTKTKGAAWSEWELVKNAKPRFPGHQQPRVPLWGYQDESDPAVMANKINAAADHGLTAFIFDWYYYNDGPFLDRPIDNGFLKATNNARLKFAFMWANHDWVDIFPYHRGEKQKLLYPGRVTPENFARICDHLLKDYFSHPSYWKIDGRPYFSFYDLEKLLSNFGSVPATRAALDAFRAKAFAAGLPGLHLNAVYWGYTVLPGEKSAADPVKLVHDLGFDSVTSYVWVHHSRLPQPQTEYNYVRDQNFSYWDHEAKAFGVPYIPNVTMGWDPSPRCDQRDELGDFGYPFTNLIKNNTPENFRAALELAKQRLLAETNGLRILNLNCWNEWTEGSYLEPDTVHGYQYLDAIKAVFGPNAGAAKK